MQCKPCVHGAHLRAVWQDHCPVRQRPRAVCVVDGAVRQHPRHKHVHRVFCDAFELQLEEALEHKLHDKNQNQNQTQFHKTVKLFFIYFFLFFRVCVCSSFFFFSKTNIAMQAAVRQYPIQTHTATQQTERAQLAARRRLLRPCGRAKPPCAACCLHTGSVILLLRTSIGSSGLCTIMPRVRACGFSNAPNHFVLLDSLLTNRMPHSNSIATHMGDSGPYNAGFAP